MRYELSRQEKGILRSIRTAPLRLSCDPYDAKMTAEVEYPKFNVTRVVDRFSGDEEITFDERR